jgi:hypothetical protein
MVAFFAAPLSVHGQVDLRLNSLHFNAYDPIKITVLNRQSRPISVCVSWRWIPEPDDHVGIAVTPFLLQSQYGGKWVTALNGVDVGPPLRLTVTIEPRRSQEFQLQMNGSGKARVVLYYWKEDNIKACDSPSGRKKTTSPTFTLGNTQ